MDRGNIAAPGFLVSVRDPLAILDIRDVDIVTYLLHHLPGQPRTEDLEIRESRQSPVLIVQAEYWCDMFVFGVAERDAQFFGYHDV